MKTVVVLSGKGGTGKTSVTAALAALESRAGTRLVLADADVDAANLPILLDPRNVEEHTFIGGELAVVAPDACNGCTLCHQHCRFGAIRMVPREDGPDLARILDTCEGCAVCSVVCPEAAIVMEPRNAGSWAVGETRFGPLVHATLSAGGETSGKLVTEVRKRAAELAGETASPLVLVDGPPGIGCPVIAAMSGADLVVAVTEPTPSARADLDRLLNVARHFDV
ncbi:MAG TPA: 4Fe-4S dicluster domain-containing protein, partial [Acidobacteria bacterium]|nr:4Fe-4S dicluster domain-containing protein [Acidobacteriota bacterium]